MPAEVDECHCGSGEVFSRCCGPLISGALVADTAAQLMRSRYTAFVMGDQTYLKKTWHPETCPKRIELSPKTRWLGLTIKHAEAGTKADSEGTVEFVARYKEAGRGYRLHEVSRFVRCDGEWRYVDGDQQG